MERIAKIVYERNKERKLLTDDDVREIYGILIEINNCTSIDNIIISSRAKEISKLFRTYAEYNYFLREIHVYKKSLLANLEELYLNMKYSLDGTMIDYYNWEYLNVIFHEFSHAMDRDRSDKKKKDFGTKVYCATTNMQFYIPRKEYYKNYYTYMPEEVCARNNGRIGALKIYNMLPNEFINMHDKIIYKQLTFDGMASNYVMTVSDMIYQSPIENVLLKIEPMITESELITIKDLMTKSKQLTLFNRLLWGFPISYLEGCELNTISNVLASGHNMNVAKILKKKQKDG